MSAGLAGTLVEALAGPAIPNRGNFPAAPGSVRRPREPEARPRGVLTVQPACCGWASDTCRARHAPRGSRR